MGNPTQLRGVGNAQRLRSCTLKLLGLRGEAGMAEGYKCVPKLMVVIEWEPALLRWLCLSSQGSKG